MSSVVISAVCGFAQIDARSWGVCPFGDGKVDADFTTVNLFTRGAFFCLYRIFQVAEVDECKSPGSTSLMIIDNLHLINGAKMTEEFPEVPLLRVQAQPKHSEAAARLGVLPTALVAPPSRHW